MMSGYKHIEFDSQLENLQLVEQFIEEVCDQYNIYNNYFGNIIIALTEAVTNAIVHGNKNEIDRKVSLYFNSSAIGLVFTVKDEGEGFDYKKVPDPTDVDFDEDSEAGRGIFLIRSLADAVQFTEGGRQIDILFKISSINSDKTLERIQLLQEYSKKLQKDKIGS